MNIEEFLEENVYNLTPEEYNQALADLDSLDANSWIQKYSALMQEKTYGWNEVDEVKRSKPLAERIANAFKDNDFAPGKNFKEAVYEKDFPDVPREKFEEALSKMKQYYDEEVRSREQEFLKEKRKQEVKDWGLLRDIATSDYEKQRYIEDPQAALFGDQAPAIGDAPETRWGSAADLGLGVAGAAGDALPGLRGFAGPGIRLARDIGHKVTDSPYQKSGWDIAKNFGVDLGTTAATAFLPNFRKQKRMVAGGLIPQEYTVIKEIEQEAKNINEGAAMLGESLGQFSPLSEAARDRSFRQAVANMPESQLKQELTPLTADVNIDWAKANAIVDKNTNAAFSAQSKLNREHLRRTVSENESPLVERANSLDDADIITTESLTGRQIPLKTTVTLDPLSARILGAKELTKKQERLAPLYNLTNKFIEGEVGSAALKTSSTALGGRSPKQAQRVRTAEEQAGIDAIKASEARFWEAGFKPNKVEGDPLWEAYQEWSDENKRKNAVKHQLLGGK